MTPAFTRADYDLLPEGFPAQLVDGLLVREPAPTYGHPRILSRLLQRLHARVGPDRALPAPVAVALDDRNVYQPDLVVLERAPAADAPEIGLPLVVFEVLSPASAARDRRMKTRRYLAAGVREVWLVDPGPREIALHATGRSEAARGDAPLRSEAVPGLVLTADALFG